MEHTNDKKWCVYIHRNKINNKAYIGITCKKPEARWGSNGCHYAEDQSVFCNAIKKYTWDEFEHIIFAENLSEYEAKHIEMLLIAIFKTNCKRYKNPEYGYNMTDGGDGTLGRRHSEETKRKIGEKATGRKWTDEQRAALSIKRQGENGSFYGKHHTDKSKEILSSKAIERLSNPENHPMWGKTQSAESNDKNMKSQNRRSIVLQFDLCNNHIATFQSLCDAEKNTGISRFLITKSCRGEIESAKGFIFKFQNPDDINRKSLVKGVCGKAVIQLTINGDFMNEHCNIRSASKATGLLEQNIGACCRGKQKTCGGFKWMYKSDYELLLTTQNYCENEIYDVKELEDQV